MEEEGDHWTSNVWRMAGWGALFVALGVVLVCAGASPGVLECRPAARPTRGIAVVPELEPATHEPRPGECVVRAGFAFEPVLAWLAPSVRDQLRDATVARFQASAFHNADGEGPVTLVLRDEHGDETLLPLHPRWTMSSRHGAKVAKRINEHFLQLRSDGVGFMYTERSNTMLVGLGVLLPSLAFYRRSARAR
ncbi:uncharacterized protein ACA1_062290 [Acanthamoeba castellanii str. Neff]|uniref:Uncharacterized protein n=1 Tax=Acanthamoeba castellanii (strain ATCC 30010 / Neff) TaxID=1257118 RepID=L8GWZ9_ACACF|nr:uncharacterized protein ACA1_062290 [Acanthamoeba castellanii str. Neff]ELR17487.1 hypothetical protein ACA1_062290 [Acanthamoeba castellanii str. Neff]